MIVDGLPLAWMPRWGKFGVIWASLESSSHNWAAEQASHLVLVRKHLFPVEKGSQTNSPRFSLEFVECIQTQNSWARPGNVWTDLISIKRIPSVIYPCFVFRLFLTKKRQLWRKSIFSVKCFQLVNNLRLSWQWAERSVTIKISQMGIPFLQNLHLATSSRAFPTAMSFSTSNLNLIQQFQLHYIKRPSWVGGENAIWGNLWTCIGWFGFHTGGCQAS